MIVAILLLKSEIFCLRFITTSFLSKANRSQAAVSIVSRCFCR